MILDEIVARKRGRLAELKGILVHSELNEAVALAPAPRDFIAALKDGGRPAVIAEIKKALKCMPDYPQAKEALRGLRGRVRWTSW